jgi:S1-C subfamily serine protease
MAGILALTMTAPAVAARSVAQANTTRAAKPDKVSEDKLYRAATFKIRAGRAYGSGFAIGPRLVVTCWHVMEDDGAMIDKATLLSGTGRRYEATLLAYDSDADVALLELSEPVDVFFRVSETEASSGDHVAVIRSRPEYVSKFTRANVYEVWGGATYAGSLTKPMELGNSGSPVVNSKYEVVGILSAILPLDKDRGVYSGISGLRRVMAAHAMVSCRI